MLFRFLKYTSLLVLGSVILNTLYGIAERTNPNYVDTHYIASISYAILILMLWIDDMPYFKDKE